MEVKSGATVQPAFRRPLRRILEQAAEMGDPRALQAVRVYGGEAGQRRSDVGVLAWHEVLDDPWGA